MKLLQISITTNKEKIATCHYMRLETFPTNTTVKFHFDNLKIKNKDLLLSSNTLTITIKIARKNKNYKYGRFILYSFDFLVFNNHIENDQSFWVSGLIKVENHQDEVFNQNLINVFNDWQNGIEVDWNNLPLFSTYKSGYLGACYFFSFSTSSQIFIEKDVYHIDMINVREANDLYYLLGKEFYGDRGYFGSSWHVFKDMLLDLHFERGAFEGRTIVFKNSKNVIIQDDLELYNDVKKVFLSNKFTVIEI